MTLFIKNNNQNLKINSNYELDLIIGIFFAINNAKVESDPPCNDEIYTLLV